MANFKLTPNARKDLKAIAKYTIKEWGQEQAVIYKDKLNACFDDIGSDKFMERNFSPKLPGLLVCRCEKHFVFYLRKTNKPAIILNVLHERMQLMQRMSKRLKEYQKSSEEEKILKKH